jgi:hypothetical protein
MGFKNKLKKTGCQKKLGKQLKRGKTSKLSKPSVKLENKNQLYKHNTQKWTEILKKE